MINLSRIINSTKKIIPYFFIVLIYFLIINLEAVRNQNDKNSLEKIDNSNRQNYKDKSNSNTMSIPVTSQRAQIVVLLF